MLDSDEYLHLAMHAASTGNPHACLSYLKEVLAREPKQPMALYLLGAQHAQLGLRTRAIEGMRAAIAAEPRLDVARFQLALLLMATDLLEARQQFEAVVGSVDETLRAFATAMVALTDNKVEIAREQLTLGLSHTVTHPGLCNMMRTLLEQLSKPAAPSPAKAVDENAFLGAYRQK
ncbi:MAG TPA: hypothetical protein VIU34_24500 [Steroidobacter sp.]